MALFQNSTLTVTNAQTRIARAGSASDFSAELTRALEALQDAVRWFNREELWEFTKAQAESITVVAGVAEYSLPYDCAAIYDVRITSNPRKLRYVPTRPYDQAVSDQSYTGVPYGYDIFKKGTAGTLQLIPTPGVGDTLIIKYYRRLWIPCAITATTAVTILQDSTSASGTGNIFAGVTLGSLATHASIPADTYVDNIISTSALTITQGAVATITNGTVTFGGAQQFLDIPADYEDGIISRAKEIYLMEREADGTRWERFSREAQSMMNRAKAANFRLPDEEIVFLAPDDVAATTNPNSVNYGSEFGY